MKLITFLGNLEYVETSYEWNEKSHKSKYSPVATASLLQADSVTVFLTKEAKEKNFDEFKQSLPDCVKQVSEVPVLPGKDQTQLWSNFTAFCNAVTPNEDVVFDITYGFRSSPLLALLAVAFLRANEKVNIKHVLYGAFDKSSPASTTVFDLTPMLALLDWANATTRFVKTGDARDLADLLNQSANGNPDVLDAAKAVSNVSLAAFLCQPIPLGLKSTEMVNTLGQAQSAIEQQVIPFGQLRERIVNDFGAFQADHRVDLHQALQAQLKLIHWYHQNNQLGQAMTLVREWLINAIAFTQGNDLPLARDEREHKIAAAINKQIKQMNNKSSDTTHQSIFAGWQESTLMDLSSLWQSAAKEVRNTLNHAGFETDAVGADEIEKLAKAAMPALDRLAHDLGIQ